MVKIGPLSDEQRQTLERVRRRAVGRVSQRAHMVLLSGRGFTVREIARVFDCGEDVGDRHVNGAESGGWRAGA